MIVREPWTPEEDDMLRQLLGKIPTHEVSQRIGRPMGGVFHRARQLRDAGETQLRAGTGNKFRDTAWTQKHLDILKANYTQFSSQEIANLTNKKLHSVYTKAYQMGLTKGKVADGDYVPMRVIISQDMIDRYLAGTPMRFLYEELGVSWHLFRKALKRQGVRLRTRGEIGLLHIHRVQEGSKRARKDPEWKKRMSATLQRIPLDEWKGFKNKEYESLRYKPEWQAWRKTIFRRDHYTCVMCKTVRPKILDPHHIIRKSERPDLIYDTDNGVALCRKCHASITYHEEDFAPQFRAHIAAKNALAAVQSDFWEVPGLPGQELVG